MSPNSLSSCSDLPRGVRRWFLLFVFAALVTGLWLRLAGLSRPPYDAHNFRQTQTLSTIEFFHADGIDLLHPRTIYAGYPGTFVLELPVFQAIAAVLYKIFGPQIEVVRVLNILLGAATLWLLFRITAFFFDHTTACLTAVIYWLAPLNILYQRSTLIDPLAVLCSLLSFQYLALYLSSRDDKTRPESVRREWLQFSVFALATLLTALIKALYLWPVILLLGQRFIARRLRLDLQLARIVAVFAVAGACFLAWNAHAARINNASPFTSGVTPTSLLGVSALFSAEFYYEMIVRRPKFWVGVLGVLLYPIGLLAGWRERSDRAQTIPFLLLALVPPTYLLLFANINHPHDYYQLIIAPFLAVVPANGLRWLLTRGLAGRSDWPPLRRAALVGACVSLVAAAPLTYLVWKKQPKLDEAVMRFEQLCAGKIEPGRSAMIFVTGRVSGLGADWYIPQYLYAAKLWGYGRSVADLTGARRYFDQFAPAFPALEYVVFYGTDRPDWIPAARYELVTHDDKNQIYIFRRDSPL